MRRAARIDANQPDIIDALRRIGASVQPLHQVGRGCPDLLVGYRGFNVLLEIKDGNKPESETTLTIDESRWHNAWRGDVQTVYSVVGALAYVKAFCGIAARTSGNR